MVSGGDVTGRDDAAVAAQTLELQEANAEELKDDTQMISKNQQKKLAKKLARKQRLQVKKQERKAAKKAQNAEAAQTRTELREQQFAAMTEEERQQHIEAQRAKKRGRVEEKQQKIKRLKEAQENAPKIILDLDFWDKMLEKERNSLVSQLGHSVGANRKSDAPCSLHLTSLNGGMLEQTKKQFPNHTNWIVEQHEEAWDVVFADNKASIVYLTADSPEQIETLDKDSLYIIGGIVDRNRYPQLCLDKARRLNVRTAKLPISEYLKMVGSKVLTVNQTVAILVKYWSCKDWKEAVTSVVPTRKSGNDAAVE